MYFLSGLSQGSDCSPFDQRQAVPTAVRDALKQRISNRYFDWRGQTPRYGKGGHWHNGHPDIKRWLNDLMPRLKGLYDRPKMLRCSREARKRAEEWLGELDSVLNRLKRMERKVTLSDGSRCQATYIAQPMKVSTYRMPTYTFRPGYYCLTKGGDITSKVVSEGGKAATAAAAAERSVSPPISSTNGRGRVTTDEAPPGPAPGVTVMEPQPIMQSFTSGSVSLPGVGSIPITWLVIGAVGLYFITRK